MATFDPDAYLAKKQEFDPDAYLAKGKKAAPTVGEMLKAEMLTSLPGGFVRGLKDMVDTGAQGAAWLYDKATGADQGNLSSLVTGQKPGEFARVKAMNQAGEADFKAAQDLVGAGGSNIARVGGQVAATYPIGGLFAKAAEGVKAPAAVVNALRSGGMSTGARPATLAAKAADMAIRSGAGAAVGGASAAAVGGDAETGALVGGLLPPGVKAAGMLGSGVKQLAAGTARNVLGTSTGTGAESVRTAYQAGKQGGTSFLDNMRGNVPFTDVLDEAKTALSQMRVDRSNAYKQGMAGVSADKTVIDFTPIDSAVNSLKSMGNYKGQVINKNASGTVDEIADLVNQWKALDPTEFHTPEGLDALKQAISDIRDTTQLGTAARKAADTAYNAVKGQITQQAPTYAKVMKDYSEASELVKEIERSLVGNQKTAADTAMRKLQSLMRNNVNTNYGNRLDLARTLESKGADILPAVAGQSMSSMTPRGLQGLSASGIAGAGLMTSNPLALAALPLTSPRLVGEAAYGLGALNRGISGGAARGGNKLAQMLAQNQGQPLTMNQLAPLLATGAVLSANPR